MKTQSGQTYEFGPFRLNPAERQLLRDGEAVALTPKAFETLVFLIERRGHLIEKEELMRALWPDTFVEEANLAHHIWRLRRVLEDSKDEERYIETIPKRGYRFVAPIKEISYTDADLVLEDHTITRLLAERESESDSVTDLLPPKDVAARQPAGLTRRTALLLIGGVLVLITLGILFLKLDKVPSFQSSNTSTPIRTLAVLPFRPLTAEGGDASLEMGMADALITRLSNLRELTVRSTSAVAKYVAPSQDVAQIGRELRVESVLDGRVQRANDRIRVTVQLIRTDDGKPLWAEKFDEEFTDIFALEDSLSAKVAAALALRLSSADTSRLQQHQTNSVDAYQSYLKGRYQMNMATEGALKAVRSFQEAIDKDPKYGLAYAGLADAHSALAFMSIGSPTDENLKAKAAAQKALGLDESLAEAHLSLANVLFNYDWNWAEAEREFKRAIELNPNLAEVHHGYSAYLQAMARFDEAFAEIQKAQLLDPLSVNINFHYGLILYGMGRDDEALEQYHKTLDIDSTTGGGGSHWGIAQIYQKRGMFSEAVQELEVARKLDPLPSWRLTSLAIAYAQWGKRTQANEFLKQVLELRKTSPVSTSAICQIYAALGDEDEAFKWLEAAYNEREPSLAYLRIWEIKLQRADPRFQAILKKMNL